MDNGWLSDAEWRMIQKNMPIVCVDILLLRTGEGGVKQIGLVYRDTPHQGRRWCLVGGRVLFNEPLREAVRRQVQETLGPDIECVLSEPLQPIFVAEYFSERRGKLLFDPRQHAVALTFAAEILGTPIAMGEAQAFRWFDMGNLPGEDGVGFGQARVFDECMRRLSNLNGPGSF